MSDSKTNKGERTVTTGVSANIDAIIGAQPSVVGQDRFRSFDDTVQEAKKEEYPARAAVAEHRARVITSLANGDRVTANHRATVLSHLANGDTSAAFQALMTDPNGRELDYAESRMMYG